jgi:hypothetical protein
MTYNSVDQLQKTLMLQNGKYIKVNRSNLLPNLDLNLFANYITYDEPFDALLEFKDKIKNNP